MDQIWNDIVRAAAAAPSNYHRADPRRIFLEHFQQSEQQQQQGALGSESSSLPSHVNDINSTLQTLFELHDRSMPFQHETATAQDSPSGSSRRLRSAYALVTTDHSRLMATPTAVVGENHQRSTDRGRIGPCGSSEDWLYFAQEQGHSLAHQQLPVQAPLSSVEDETHPTTLIVPPNNSSFQQQHQQHFADAEAALLSWSYAYGERGRDDGGGAAAPLARNQWLEEQILHSRSQIDQDPHSSSSCVATTRARRMLVDLAYGGQSPTALVMRPSTSLMSSTLLNALDYGNASRARSTTTGGPILRTTAGDQIEDVLGGHGSSAAGTAAAAAAVFGTQEMNQHENTTIHAPLLSRQESDWCLPVEDSFWGSTSPYTPEQCEQQLLAPDDNSGGVCRGVPPEVSVLLLSDGTHGRSDEGTSKQARNKVPGSSLPSPGLLAAATSKDDDEIDKEPMLLQEHGVASHQEDEDELVVVEDAKEESCSGSSNAMTLPLTSNHHVDSQKAETYTGYGIDRYGRTQLVRPTKRLSTYNVFYSEERHRLLSQNHKKANNTTGENVDTPDEEDLCTQGVLNSAETSASIVTSLNDDRGSRRKRRKKAPHGKIGFEALSRHIAARWKAIDKEELAFCQAKAESDRERYNTELDMYQQVKQADLTRRQQELEKTVDQETKRRYIEAHERKNEG